MLSASQLHTPHNTDPDPASAHASCSYLLHSATSSDRSARGRAVYSSMNANKKLSIFSSSFPEYVLQELSSAFDSFYIYFGFVLWGLWCLNFIFCLQYSLEICWGSGVIFYRSRKRCCLFSW